MKPVPLHAVVYAKDLAHVAGFYERTVGLSRLEVSDRFVLLGNGQVELSVVQIPEPVAAEIVIASPPRPREDTPIKLSFFVDDLDAARIAAGAAGGGLQPASAAWDWRGCRHLDGFDPEGNVFQVRAVVDR